MCCRTQRSHPYQTRSIEVPATSRFHGLKGALLLQLNRPLEARHALDKAISLARSPVEADHIRQKLDALAELSSK